MVLNRLAQRDAPVHHRFVVGHIEDEQVLLVAEDARYGVSTFLADVTVGKVKVGQCFVLFDSLGKNLGAFNSD